MKKIKIDKKDGIKVFKAIPNNDKGNNIFTFLVRINKNGEYEFADKKEIKNKKYFIVPDWNIGDKIAILTGSYDDKARYYNAYIYTIMDIQEDKWIIQEKGKEIKYYRNFNI